MSIIIIIIIKARDNLQWAEKVVREMPSREGLWVLESALNKASVLGKTHFNEGYTG